MKRFKTSEYLWVVIMMFKSDIFLSSRVDTEVGQLIQECLFGNKNQPPVKSATKNCEHSMKLLNRIICR